MVTTPTTGVQELTNNTIINNQNITTNEVPVKPADIIGNIISSPLPNVVQNVIFPVIIPFRSIINVTNPAPTQPRPGTQQNTTIDTGDGKHLACVVPNNFADATYCVLVDGEGDDQCTNVDEMCSGSDDNKHMTCVATEKHGNICQLVDGEGENTCQESTNCSTDNDDWHLGCVPEVARIDAVRCGWVKGEGTDECSLVWSDSPSCYDLYDDKHTQCVDGLCQWTDGHGINQCDPNNKNACGKTADTNPAITTATQKIKKFFSSVWVSFVSLFKR
jgi:hypothetical protein